MIIPGKAFTREVSWHSISGNSDVNEVKICYGSVLEPVPKEKMPKMILVCCKKVFIFSFSSQCEKNIDFVECFFFHPFSKLLKRP